MKITQVGLTAPCNFGCDVMKKSVVSQLFAGIARLLGRDMKASGPIEGGSTIDRTMQTWNPPMTSADSSMLGQKNIVDSRTQDLQRNDGYIQSGSALHKDNIVGHMFLFNSKPAMQVLGMNDEVWQKEFQEEIESKFTIAAESVNNYLDVSGNNTLTEMVRLAIGVYSGCGEFLATAEWMPKNQMRPFQTAIQAVDTGRVKTPWKYMNDKNVRSGFRLNKSGMIKGAYILNHHPGDNSLYKGDNIDSWKYVKLKKKWGRQQLIYIREQMRPHQTRGVSEIVAGLKELNITRKFRDITLQNAVVNAQYAAAIESEMPTEAVFAAMGAGGNDPSDSFQKYGQGFLNATAAYTKQTSQMHIDGIKLPHLFPGTKLNMMPAGKIGGVGQDFERSLLRYIAAILGVSYEQLTKDYSQINYAGNRAATNETLKFMMSRKRIVADKLAFHILRLWFEEAVASNSLYTMQYRAIPNMYEGQNFDALTNGTWIGASRGQVDELKETQAAVLRIKNNLSTREEEIARQGGKDWRKVFAQLGRERKILEQNELWVDEKNGNGK